MAIKTEAKKQSYFFKKETIKDDKGNKIGEGKKHPTIEGVEVPFPTSEGLLEIISNGGKGLEFLVEVAADAVDKQVKRVIAALRESKGADGEVTAAEVQAKMAEADWDHIANLPKAERKGAAIPDEDFDAFFADYRSIMPKVTGKDADRIEKHVAIFKRKLASVKNDKKALEVLLDALRMWAGNTASMEDNQEVYDYLLKRAETLIAEEVKVLAEAL